MDLKCLHQVGLDRVLHEHRKGSSYTDVVSSDRIALLARRNHHIAQPLPHILKTRRQREDSHALARDRDVKPCDALLTLLRRVLTDSDLAQEPVVHVQDAVPCDRLRIDVEAGEACDFFWCKLIRVRFVDAELLQAFEHEWCEFSLAFLCRYETRVERLGGESQQKSISNDVTMRAKSFHTLSDCVASWNMRASRAAAVRDDDLQLISDSISLYTHQANCSLLLPREYLR